MLKYISYVLLSYLGYGIYSEMALTPLYKLGYCTGEGGISCANLLMGFVLRLLSGLQ